MLTAGLGLNQKPSIDRTSTLTFEPKPYNCLPFPFNAAVLLTKVQFFGLSIFPMYVYKGIVGDSRKDFLWENVHFDPSISWWALMRRQWPLEVKGQGHCDQKHSEHNISRMHWGTLIKFATNLCLNLMGNWLRVNVTLNTVSLQLSDISGQY